MTQQAYRATVDQQVADTKAKMVAVHKESVQRLVEVMQTTRDKGGNLRFDTGFLRASLKAAIGTANFALVQKPDAPGAKYIFDMSSISLVIVGAEISDPIEVVYTAAYARPREYGARGQPGDRWVALAAQQWPQVVDGAVRDLKARGGG